MHFVWVLRDWFYFEREHAEHTGEWVKLCERWRKNLDLPEWVRDIGWWKHPKGEYKSNPNYVVHPCHRTIGWTKQGIIERVKRFGLKDISEEDISV